MVSVCSSVRTSDSDANFCTGLHHDDEVRYAERLNLWHRFNLCWEALGQKQRDTIEETIRTGHEPADILSAETMTRLVDELVIMCDQLEQYGLVDYEMGVAEEQIIGIFTVCLDLTQRHGARGTPGSSRPRS